MARYEVQHRYQSGLYGPWDKGHTVEVEPHEADWINHDSPGTLAPAKPPVVKPGFERARQQPAPEPETPEPPLTVEPVRRRPGRPPRNR